MYTDTPEVLYDNCVYHDWKLEQYLVLLAQKLLADISSGASGLNTARMCDKN